MKEIVSHPQIGEIVFCTRRDASRTTFRVSVKDVRITTSVFLRNSVFPLSQERVDWILNARGQLVGKHPDTFQITPNTVIETAFFKIKLLASNYPRLHFSLQREGELAIVFFREDLDLSTSQNQLALRRIIGRLLREEAQSYLPKRLSELAEAYGFSFSEVHINAACGRWGSCSSRKRINLSLYLMLLSKDLIDFVLLHELCHTEQMNHGVFFKRRMKGLFVDNYDELDGRLKSEGRRIESIKI